MPWTPLSCCSSGVVTLSATICALAPGYVALTMIWGGVIAGNCEIGRTLSAIAPASTMMMATAEAKTGRLMKKSTMAASIHVGGVVEPEARLAQAGELVRRGGAREAAAIGDRPRGQEGTEGERAGEDRDQRDPRRRGVIRGRHGQDRRGKHPRRR